MKPLTTEEERAEVLRGLSRIHISEARIHQALQLPKDFAMWSENRDRFCGEGKDWSLGPTIVHRDSGLLDESNAYALEEELKRMSALGVFSEDDWDIAECSHWAVGWVKHLTFWAVDLGETPEDPDEEVELKPTTVFRFVEHWYSNLERYSIADEEDYSRRQMEGLEEDIKWEYSNIVGDNAPDDWAEQLAGELWSEAYTGDRDRLTLDSNIVHNAIKQRGWEERETG